MNTFGENVTRVPKRASRTAAAAAINSSSGGASRSARGDVTIGTLVLAQRSPVSQPDHALAADPCRRDIVAGPDPIYRGALLLAGHRDHDDAGARDRGKREGQAR